jgi:hypothetical protein
MSRSHRDVKIEEYYCILGEPGNKFLGHASLTGSASAKNIASSIFRELQENNVDLSDVVGIGCDGTNTNVGSKGGVIRVFENHLGRPLQWCICLLHFIELPLRHLLIEIDGGTTGPYTFYGPIGRLLANSETNPVCAFENIEYQLR